MAYAISDDKSFSSTTAFDRSINRTLVISNEYILLDELFFSQIPIEVARNHIILHSFVAVIFLEFVRLFKGLIIDAGEEG